MCAAGGGVVLLPGDDAACDTKLAGLSAADAKRRAMGRRHEESRPALKELVDATDTARSGVPAASSLSHIAQRLSCVFSRASVR